MKSAPELKMQDSPEELDEACPHCGSSMGTMQSHKSMLNEKSASKKGPIKSMMELKIAIGKHMGKKGK